ncbi:geranyltranstransferase [Desulfosarcina cetonica]|uniref:polyprenyl synthetase family protein n=1 Tax=Desulfosarcina cetonica TaxID=90730 RepID=UPI0006CF2711|nr:farnesyl diphosphate synthase [Desulfosarcina cetonica]VTR64965.1 geranyltranstransferase [Desulfosarcina cetonica]
MFNLKPYMASVRELVDARLEGYLSGTSRIVQAMRYSVLAGGKRLRPILCIAAAESLGGARKAVLPMACALECVHTYSLIHDDLPAMDDDDLRRGKPTCHVQFGEATAILAGDALLTLAFEILSDAGRQSDATQSPRWLMAIGQLAGAAGWNGMILGQMRDVENEGNVLPLNDLETLHRLKTGRMIEASVTSAGLLCGAAPEAQGALLAYGQNIGLAFQVADDILNIKGDPKKLGKAVGTDQIRGKNTYPAHMGLQNAEAYACQLINNALKALDLFDKKADSLRAIARYVIERKR